MRAALVIAALIGGAAAPALAEDQVAYGAIARADYARAERALAPQVAAGERDPGVLLNLAAVYVQTGRPAAAAELYRMVQDEDDARLVPAVGRAAWSHDIASRGLQYASR